MNFDKNHVARKKSIPTGTRIFRRISLTALKIFLVLLLFCVILGTLNVASLRYFSGEYHLWRWVFNFQGSVHTKRFFPS